MRQSVFSPQRQALGAKLHREMAVQKTPQAKQQQNRGPNPGGLAPSVNRMFRSTSVCSAWLQCGASFQTAQAESPPKKMARPTSIQVATFASNRQLLQMPNYLVYPLENGKKALVPALALREFGRRQGTHFALLCP